MNYNISFSADNGYYMTWSLAQPDGGPGQSGGIFNGIWAAEPVYTHDNQHQVKWQAKEVKTHYPAEHALNGTYHDAEMHIKFSDVDNMHSSGCDSGKAVLAIFFNKTAGADVGNFFNFTTDPE